MELFEVIYLLAFIGLGVCMIVQLNNLMNRGKILDTSKLFIWFIVSILVYGLCLVISINQFADVFYTQLLSYAQLILALNSMFFLGNVFFMAGEKATENVKDRSRRNGLQERANAQRRF